MRLTLLEQSNLRVSSRAEGPEQSVSHDDAAALVDLAERMETPFVTWTGPNRLRIHQFVGLIRAGDLQLEILPKIDGLLEPAYIRRNLLTMLAKTQDLDVKESEAAAFAETSEPFACALARLYCRRLLEAVRRGLRQDYVLHHEALPRVRGKISWPSQLRLQATARLEFSCLFDERSEDTPVNRTFKAALLAAGPFLDESRSSSLVSELRHSMAAVSAACPSPEQLRRLRTDRMNRHLESLLSLARLILGSRNPDFGRASRPTRTTFALIWDMNVLFEEYVGRVAAEVLGARGCDVDLQENASSYLAREVLHRQGNAFLLRPDILVRRGRRPIAVADTKWKQLAASEGNLGVSGPDVYQVLAYARRQALDLAVLVYPHHPALGPPGPQLEFLTHGPRSATAVVRVVTVDLAHLESVPSQIERGLLGGATVAAA